MAANHADGEETKDDGDDEDDDLLWLEVVVDVGWVVDGYEGCDGAAKDVEAVESCPEAKDENWRQNGFNRQSQLDGRGLKSLQNL